MEYRTVWLAIGWTMVAAAIAASLFPASISEIGFDNEGKDVHVVAYFLVMLWLGQLYPSRAGRAAVACGLVVMGIGLEVLQGMLGVRAENWLDAVANAAGVACGWIALKTPLGNSVLWLDHRVAQSISNTESAGNIKRRVYSMFELFRK